MQNHQNLRLWVLELCLEDDGIFRIYCHFGELEDEHLIKNLRNIREHVDEAVKEFEDTVSRKLKKDKSYRIVENGEHVPSRGLLNMLAPKHEARGKIGVRINRDNSNKPVKSQEPPQEEHRRIKYD